MIAIVDYPGAFSNRWIEYCKNHGIDYKVVNPYESNIVDQVKDCEAFMWHFSQDFYKDMLFARPLLFSLQQRGLKVFPDFKTCWYFDDKLGEKYLLESIDAPIVPSYAFYTKKEAYDWIEKTDFPKVFKLRGGAGSANVKLVRNAKEAKRLVKVAFGKGFSHYNHSHHMHEYFRKYKEGQQSALAIIKGIYRYFIPNEYGRMSTREKGYVLFQDFIPNNRFDIRVIVIGEKAFAIKRMVRPGDFRASGGGNFVFDRLEIPENAVRVSFEVTKKLQSQCTGFDFVFDDKGQLFIVEIGYGFAVKAYDKCPGYWTNDMQWHEGSFTPQEWMIQNLFNK